MPLSQTAEYALRAMACLVMAPGGRPLRAVDIARQAGIPRAYLSKVLRRLVEDGVLLSRRGHGGGFVLARPPEELCFREIVESADQERPADRCAFGWETCDSSSPCPLHPAWSRLKDSFQDWLSATTLDQISAGPSGEA